MKRSLDPAHARAYAGIADCDSFLFLHYHVDVSIEAILGTSAQATGSGGRWRPIQTTSSRSTMSRTRSSVRLTPPSTRSAPQPRYREIETLLA